LYLYREVSEIDCQMSISAEEKTSENVKAQKDRHTSIACLAKIIDEACSATVQMNDLAGIGAVAQPVPTQLSQGDAQPNNLLPTGKEENSFR
jgi:hypothetical protein